MKQNFPSLDAHLHRTIGLSLRLPTALLNRPLAQQAEAIGSNKQIHARMQFKKAVEDHREGHAIGSAGLAATIDHTGGVFTRDLGAAR